LHNTTQEPDTTNMQQQQQQQQYPISPLTLNYNESPFIDPFFETFLADHSSKKEPKLQLEIPHGDNSLQFLSPSVLSAYDVGLEQIFQPLLDNDSPPRNVATPTTFMDNNEQFHFEPQVLNAPAFLGIHHPIEHLQQLPESKVLPPQEDSMEELEEEEPAKSSKKEIPLNRVWSTAFKKEALVGDGDVEITLKTRREKATNLVPERLYSSLKYELQITANGKFVRSLPFLLARIQVVDAKTFEPITKNNKAVTKGENESALTHPPNGPGNIIKGAIKVQFDSSISYHHDKREVCLEIGFFMNEALDQPILIKRTVPVKMFARKPNKKPNKAEKSAPAASASKRKREPEAVEEQQQPKIAKTQHSSDFNDFVQRLDELVSQSQNLSFEDRQRATNLILSKFGLSVPFLFATNNPYELYHAQNQQSSTQFNHQI